MELHETGRRVKPGTLLLVLSLSIIISALFSIKPMRDPTVMVLEARTGFAFESAVRVYEYDAQEFREYDGIAVYRLGKDAERFENHAAQFWNPLPLADEIARHHTLNVGFDPCIQQMISQPNGYWRFDDRGGGAGVVICVYDSDEKLLYVRAWYY